jgi:uncharacterized surface protein with fasciclin (FAS1) repeats
MLERQPSQSRLQRVGANILGAGVPGDGSRTPSVAGSSRGDGRVTPGALSVTSSRDDAVPPAAPPSVTRSGRLYSDATCPQLGVDVPFAQNLTALKGIRKHRMQPSFEDIPQAVWSDGCQHLANEDTWPSHGIPIFIFCGRDRPRPNLREQFKFVIRDEAYVNFLVRMRCGAGDRYAGGSIGLVHSPDRRESSAGCEGQMVMITDMIVNNDSSVIVTAVGDLEFRVLQAWIPRGMQGIQMAHVELAKRTTHLDPILETCDLEPALTRFGSLLRSVPSIEQTLQQAGPFTVFVPSAEALSAALDGVPEAALSARLEAILRCHICEGKVAQIAMYSGRVLKAIDGTVLTLTFGHWPRGDPRINGVPVEQMDVMCTNGIIHGLSAMLTPNPKPGRPTWGR